jgi:nucleoside-diphosphate-sugar epimerase
MLRGEQPTIHGDGEQSRDSTFVENVVDANLRACTAAAGEVAGRASRCHRAPCDAQRNLCGAAEADRDNAPARYGPERVGDIKHSHADISRIENAIGYSPKVNSEEGLRRTVEWYRTQAVAAR